MTSPDKMSFRTTLFIWISYSHETNIVLFHIFNSHFNTQLKTNDDLIAFGHKWLICQWNCLIALTKQQSFWLIYQSFPISMTSWNIFYLKNKALNSDTLFSNLMSKPINQLPNTITQKGFTKQIAVRKLFLPKWHTFRQTPSRNSTL